MTKVYHPITKQYLGSITRDATPSVSGNTYVFNVKDATTGQPIPNAYINLFVNTTPQTGWPFPNCNSTPGYPIQEYTDANGTATQAIEGTCPQSPGGTVSANGYNDLPVNVGTGDITGPVGFTFSMTQGNNVYGGPPGQGFTAGTGNTVGNFTSNPTSVMLVVLVIAVVLGGIAAIVFAARKKK